jgi:hypothetical protein
MTMNKNLTHAISSLVAYIKSYESDTFTASGEGVTQDSAEYTAANLIAELEERLDGVMVGNAYDQATLDIYWGKEDKIN